MRDRVVERVGQEQEEAGGEAKRQPVSAAASVSDGRLNSSSGFYPYLLAPPIVKLKSKPLKKAAAEIQQIKVVNP